MFFFYSTAPCFFDPISSQMGETEWEGAIYSMTGEGELHLRHLEAENYCLREIIQHLSEGVILTDQDCRITVFNPAKERMEQMEAQEVLGKISWDAYSHSSKEISEHKKVFDSGTPILNAYRPHAYVGNIPIYIYYSTYPVVRNGEILGVYTISRNEAILRELLYETIEHKRLLNKKEETRPEPGRKAQGTQYTFSDMVGSSPVMKNLLREAQTIAMFNTPVLITGETGTGKEVLAQSIHNFGRERKKFVAINCAAIPENLVESVLFGTVKGAFTGSLNSSGLFREAEDGTLFLDEINSMSTVMQAKLLRALQEMSVRPVGSAKEYPIRCRLICASNEEPDVLIREKRLRSDLFYRISGFCLSLPPLRERKDDTVELAQMFIKRYDQEFGKHVSRMSLPLENWIRNGLWPGNTRELQNIIQNMMLQVEETEEELAYRHIPSYARFMQSDSQTALVQNEGKQTELPLKGDLNEILRNYQRQLLEQALRESGGNVTRAAASLGIGRQNLTARMKRLSLKKDERENE